MKFNSGTNTWEVVGTPGFSDGEVWGTSLSIDNSGTLYVAYRDNAHSGKATVMKFNGSTWESVGTKAFSDGTAEYVSLSLYNGTPYLLYSDYAHGAKATVMKFIKGPESIVCSATTPPQRPGYGQQCTTAPNACGQRNIGYNICLTGGGV
jgi:hypothetical protein